MIDTPGRPSRLAALIDEPDGGVLALPPGRVVSDEDGQPLMWLSDAEPDAATVARLRALHATTGLWPVLLGDDPNWDADKRVTGPTPESPDTPPFYPLLSGSIGKSRPQSAEPSDPEAWLAEEWDEIIAENEDDEDADPEDRVSAHAPAGAAWPGLAPAAEPADAPHAVADRSAAMMLADQWLGRPRLALFEGADSAAALAAARWAPSECDDFEAQTQVLRTWEQRFGARVVALKRDTIFLSVAAPPKTIEHMVHIACEHLVFCPDMVWQESESFAEYAEAVFESLEAVPVWSFWWD